MWVGTSSLPALSVLVTDLATGRAVTIPATEDTDEWWIAFPELIIGHAYLFQLTVGINPVQFYPYVLASGVCTADTTLVDGVVATPVKVWEADGDTYYTSYDQCLNIS